MCVCVCVHMSVTVRVCIQRGGHCPVSVFYCVDGGAGWGRTKTAVSGSLEFNDVCGKVCVCERRGRFGLGLSLLKSHTSGLVIWKGCIAAQTHTEREREERKERILIVLKPLFYESVLAAC